MMFVIGIVAALVLFAAICWRSLHWGAFVLLASLPVYLIRFNVGPLPTTLLEVLFTVLLVAYLVRFFYDREFFVSFRELLLHPIVRWIGCGVLLLFVGGVLGLTQTSDLLSSLGILKSYLVEPALFGLMLLHINKQDRYHAHQPIVLFARALSIPTAMISVWALVQWSTGITIPIEWFVERRATSIFPYPNAVGHFVAPIVVFLFATLLYRKPMPIFRRSSEMWYVGVIVLGLLAMLASQTEAALIGTIFAMGVGAFYLIHRPLKQRLLVGGAALAVLLIVLLGVSPLRQKVLLQDWSGQTRTAQWSETWNLLTASTRTFAFGVGTNNYPTAVRPFHTVEHFEIFQYPHNIVLNIWVELGMLGLLGFAVIALTIGKSWIHGSRFSILASLPLLEMTVHGLVDVPFFKNDLSMFTFAFLALWLTVTLKPPKHP